MKSVLLLVTKTKRQGMDLIVRQLMLSKLREKAKSFSKD